MISFFQLTIIFPILKPQFYNLFWVLPQIFPFLACDILFSRLCAARVINNIHPKIFLFILDRSSNLYHLPVLCSTDFKAFDFEMLIVTEDYSLHNFRMGSLVCCNEFDHEHRDYFSKGLCYGLGLCRVLAEKPNYRSFKLY